jgi:probable phosphoglycerate mutase
MTTLLLTRHGETIDNVKHIIQGQSQGELNEKGIQQMIGLRERLKHEPIFAFVSSDLKRSYDSCKIIAEPHGVEVYQTPLLRERDCGSFTGRYIPEIGQDEKWPSDMETLPLLLERANNFLNEMMEKFPNKTVLAVGHGIINKAIQSVFFNKPIHKVPKMNNAELRELKLHPERGGYYVSPENMDETISLKSKFDEFIR